MSGTVSVADMKDIVAAAVAAALAESRKPIPPSAREQAEIEQAQQLRADASQDVLARLEQDRAFQKMCKHEHANGDTHAVWVQDSDIPGSAGYIYCQKCSGRVRPENENMRKLDPGARFDTALFNTLFQKCNSGDIFG